MILFGMVICGAVLTTQDVRSFNPQPDPPKASAFGPVSLSQTQALRANVVHLHGDGPGRAGANAPDDTVPVEIHALNLEGEIVGSARLMLRVGQGGFVDLDGADLMRDHPELFGRDGRAQVRVEVHPPDPGARVGGITPCVFPATVELFDNLTGQTMVVWENPVNAVSGIQPTPF
jgi:hypothetical protein